MTIWVDEDLKAKEEAQKQENAKDIEVSFNKLLKAFAFIVLDEINILRVKAELAERTKQQLKNAVKAKYESLG